MAEKEVMLTKGGLERLKEELRNLKLVKRPEVTARIKQALAFGDISENSEYDDAKNEQAFIEGRIKEMENIIANAKLIEDEKKTIGIVGLGSKVKVKDLEFDEIMEYTIVGSAEAKPALQMLSNESPLGKALMGQQAGANVEVSAPSGIIKYLLMDVQ